MSELVFPQLPGLAWGMVKVPTWSSRVQKSVSGKRQAVGYMSYPTYKITLSFNVLREYASHNDVAELQGFFNQMRGQVDTFKFVDPLDAACSDQNIGTGNGTKTQFQLVRNYGGFVEPVQTPNIVSVKAAGTTIPSAGIDAPATPVLGQVAGGTQLARTYFVRLSYVDAAGCESNSSIESSFAVSANNVLTVQSPSAVASATAYRVYINTATNTEKFIAEVAIGTNYTEPTGGLSFTGASYPTTNRTGYSIGSTGIVTFKMAVKNGVAVTWTGTYHWRCAFTQDTLDLINNDGVDIWKTNKITFETVKA